MFTIEYLRNIYFVCPENVPHHRSWSLYVSGRKDTTDEYTIWPINKTKSMMAMSFLNEIFHPGRIPTEFYFQIWCLPAFRYLHSCLWIFIKLWAFCCTVRIRVILQYEELQLSCQAVKSFTFGKLHLAVKTHNSSQDKVADEPSVHTVFLCSNVKPGAVIYSFVIFVPFRTNVHTWDSLLSFYSHLLYLFIHLDLLVRVNCWQWCPNWV